MLPIRTGTRTAIPFLTAFLLTGCLDPDIRLGRPLSAPAPSAPPPVQAEVVTDPVDDRQVEAATVEGWIVVYTNQARDKEKLPPLAEDPRLAAVARAHSENMKAQSFFSHVDPEGRTQHERLRQSYPGLSLRGSGENIARYPVVVGSDQDLAKRLVDGWLASPGHRANILKPAYTTLGAGIAQQGRDVFATQVFAIVN